MIDSVRPPLSVSHVVRELDRATQALDEADLTRALGHLMTARGHLDRVPSAGADELAYVAFERATHHFDLVQRAIARGEGSATALSRAIASHRAAAEGLGDRPAAPGSTVGTGAGSRDTHEV